MLTIAPAATTVNWQVVDPADALAQFRLGYDLYVAREAYDRCASAEQRRGYLAANRAEAIASLPRTAADRLGF